MHSQLYKPIAKSWLLCIIMLDLLCLGTIEANLDCSELMNTQLLEKCCRTSKLANYIFKQTTCSSFLKNDPCRYDCLYKHWGLLNAHEQLQVENVNTMIAKLYSKGHEQSYGSVVRNAFMSCDRLISKYAEFIQLYSTQQVQSNCTLRAFAYAKCVSINVFLNCPRKIWTNTEQCDMASLMANNCAGMLNSMGNATDMPREGPSMRSAAVGLRHKRRVKTYWYTSFFNWLVF